jgi:shikimate kinase
MKTSIALIGFMGTGKTAVGKILAEKLNKQFVELDTLIAQRAGKSIPEIFKDGEIAFREMEIAMIKEVSSGEKQVISCGGGMVLNKINIDRLQQDSRIVLLTASPLVILKRTSGNIDRPLLDTQNRLQSVRELLKFRKPFYERAADFSINTSRLNIEAVAGQIIEKLRQDEGFHF